MKNLSFPNTHLLLITSSASDGAICEIVSDSSNYLLPLPISISKRFEPSTQESAPQLYASKLINDAPTSNIESIKVESRLNNSVAIHAPNLKITKNMATETALQVANLISLAIAGSAPGDALEFIMLMLTSLLKETGLQSSTCHQHDDRPVFHAVETACRSRTQRTREQPYNRTKILAGAPHQYGTWQ